MREIFKDMEWTTRKAIKWGFKMWNLISPQTICKIQAVGLHIISKGFPSIGVQQDETRVGRVLDNAKLHYNANVMTSVCKAHVLTLTRIVTIGRSASVLKAQIPEPSYYHIGRDKVETKNRKHVVNMLLRLPFRY